MAKFEFSLETLKKYREKKLLTARKDLAAIEAELSKLRGAKTMAQEGLKDSVQASHPRVGQGTMAHLGLYSSISESQHALLRSVDVEIKRVETDAERHRNWVAHLGKELKAVEKLEEKKRVAWELNEKKADRRRADGWVAERWTRNGGAA